MFSLLHLGLLDGEVLCLTSTFGNVREIIAQSIYHTLTESQAEKIIKDGSNNHFQKDYYTPTLMDEFRPVYQEVFHIAHVKTEMRYQKNM